jgi:hypothetical protein
VSSSTASATATTRAVAAGPSVARTRADLPTTLAILTVTSRATTAARIALQRSTFDINGRVEGEQREA